MKKISTFLFFIFFIFIYQINKQEFPKHKWNKADYLGKWIPSSKYTEGSVTIYNNFNLSFETFLPNFSCHFDELYRTISNDQSLILKCKTGKNQFMKKQIVYISLYLSYSKNKKIHLSLNIHKNKICLKNEEYFKENELYSTAHRYLKKCSLKVLKGEIRYFDAFFHH